MIDKIIKRLEERLSFNEKELKHDKANSGIYYNRISENKIAIDIVKQVAEEKNIGCEYCRGEKPLTDKIYDDGSKFDDREGISIDKIGKIPILKAYIREKYFSLYKNLTPDQRKYLASTWAVEINYCPICGRPLQRCNE